VSPLVRNRSSLARALALAGLALSGSGLTLAQESRPTMAGGPQVTPSPAFFKKPKIVEKAEKIYKKITAAGFYPTIRGLAEGTGIGPGLTFWKPHPFGGPVGILGTVGWNPRVLLLEARLGRVPSRPGKIPDRRFTLEALTTDSPEGSNYPWFVFLEARLANITDDRLYFTTGPGGIPEPVDRGDGARFLDESAEAVTVHFSAATTDADVVAGYHSRRGLAASARVGYVRARTELDPGEEDTPGLPLIPGVNDTTEFARARLDLIFDRRDVRNRAHRGFLLYGTWLHMDQQGSVTPYGFNRLAVDLRAFVSTPSRRHTLALRFLGGRDEPGAGKAVPFYFQRTLGGNHTLRSYPIFRFRGTRLWAVSAEYRLAVYRWLELAALYDGGEITGGVEALGSQGFRDSLGVSARWVTETDVIFRGFAAYGREGWRFSGSGAFSF
jgi:hypothetical protein